MYKEILKLKEGEFKEKLLNELHFNVRKKPRKLIAKILLKLLKLIIILETTKANP